MKEKTKENIHKLGWVAAATIVDSQEDERIYDLRGIEKQSETGLVIKNGIKVIKN